MTHPIKVTEVEQREFRLRNPFLSQSEIWDLRLKEAIELIQSKIDTNRSGDTCFVVETGLTLAGLEEAIDRHFSPKAKFTYYLATRSMLVMLKPSPRNGYS